MARQARGYKVNVSRFPDIARMVQKWINDEEGYLLEVAHDGFVRIAPGAENKFHYFELFFIKKNRLDVVEDGSPFAEILRRKAVML